MFYLLSENQYKYLFFVYQDLHYILSYEILYSHKNINLVHSNLKKKT